MTFTFKLARRLAIAHLASLAIALVATACAPGKPLEGGLEPPPDSVLAVHAYPDSVTLRVSEFVDFTAVADLQGGGNSAVRVEWSTTGGTITADGRYTATETGTKKVIGRYRNGKADTSTVIVVDNGPPPPTLVRIDVTPTTVALLPSASRQFSATGVLSNGNNTAVTVTWSTTGGTVDASGFYFAPSTPGSYLVVATQQGGTLADTARVTVTQPTPTLAAVVLTPATTSLQFGQTQQFVAQGQLTDGTLTSIAVTWTATGGSVNSSGLYTAGNTAGTFRVIAASATGLADTSTVTISAPTVTAITVTPATASLQSGQTQQFTAQATLSNGSTQSNPQVTWTATGGNINSSGLFTAGVTAGTFRVIASSANGRADTSNVTITLPTITAVTVTPATVSLTTGATQQFSASATLSNGGTQTNPAVTWSATGGTITSGGLYTAGSTAGTFRVIAASANGRADTSTVTITPATITAVTVTPATVSLTTGATQQFSASATLSDGGTQANPALTWTATGGTITSGGLYTAGNTAGTFRVIARAANGPADTSTVTLTAPTITAITVTPASASLATGGTQQFTAQATLSTGGTQNNPPVTWTATGGTITSGGLYTAGSTAGTFRVIAASANGHADTSSVTLTAPTITAIVVSPGSATLATGATQQFTAAATLSTGGTQSNTPVTWSATGGTITSGGLYTAGGTQGTFRVIAVQQGGTLADTSVVTITSSAPPSGLYPNKPASFTNFTELDFSQSVPTQPDNVDRPIPGATTGWNMIYFGDSWRKSTDATAPQSAPGIWVGRWEPGSYGGGVIGQGSGHGIGNVFTTTPSSTSRMYLSMRVYFDFDANQWHPISNKFVNIETNAGLLLVQLKEGSYWRHAEELVNGSGSWWIDPENSPGQVDNRPVPVRQWTQIEVLIDLPNKVFKIWQDGVLTTNASPAFKATAMHGAGWYAFRGGGGETLTSALEWRYDHFYVAW